MINDLEILDGQIRISYDENDKTYSLIWGGLLLKKSESSFGLEDYLKNTKTFNFGVDNIFTAKEIETFITELNTMIVHNRQAEEELKLLEQEKLKSEQENPPQLEMPVTESEEVTNEYTNENVQSPNSP